MSHLYGTFDTRTASAEFIGMPFQYGYMNHMRLDDHHNVIYVGKGHEMFRVLYKYCKDYINIVPVEDPTITVQLKRDGRHVTQQVMDFLREDNRIVKYLKPAPEYTRSSESLSFSKSFINTTFDIQTVPFDELEFNARFLNCNRMACEYTIHLEHDEEVWDVEMDIMGNAFIARDPIDDNHFRYQFKGEVPSIIDMVKALIEVFHSDLYKVRYAKPVEQSADTVTGGS